MTQIAVFTRRTGPGNDLWKPLISWKLSITSVVSVKVNLVKYFVLPVPLILINSHRWNLFTHIVFYNEWIKKVSFLSTDNICQVLKRYKSTFSKDSGIITDILDGKLYKEMFSEKWVHTYRHKYLIIQIHIILIIIWCSLLLNIIPEKHTFSYM